MYGPGALVTSFTGLRWRLVLAASLAVAVLGWVIGYLSVFVFVASMGILSRREVSDAEIQAFGDVMVYGGPILHLGLVLVAARWLSLKVGERFLMYGVCIGLLSTMLHQVMGLNWAPFTVEQAARYLALALVGGLLGGLWGRATWERREALYNTSLRLGSAADAGDTVAAIGESLAGPDVGGVILLRAVVRPGESSPEKLEPLAHWPAENGPGLPLEALVDGGVIRAAGLSGGTASPVLLRSGEMPEDWKEARKSRNVGSVLLLPLHYPGAAESAPERRVSALAVTFRRKLWRPSRGVVRDYQTIAVQVTLALENMRLLEEARRAGREAGVLVERQRLAHEIHDTLAQGFNSIVIKLETMERRLPPAAAAARTDLDSARATARESLAEARRLIWALRPEALDRHSLPEALQTLAERWSGENDARAGVSVSGTPRQLPTEVETALLRTAQETLSNARKHARASRVMLTLSYMKGLVVLDAWDDGVGFDPGGVSREAMPHDTGGFGLRAMRERISQLGGSVTVESEPGEGTSLAVELPVAEGAEKQGDESPAEPEPPGVELQPAGETARRAR
ncbi:sensor histidine kinase [Rubrobacter aplysinae]|uniref:sensor histidine kinase n=1 Tax=Rubrobacter aplysinae TaxID=909625 RepID=UPI00069E1FDB|nr:sensor histidine kinase [Rubrobacter aplysinae]